MKHFSPLLRIVIGITMLSALIVSLPSPVAAESGTFPSSPFNGMQITYSFSGATATSTQESSGFTVSRTIIGNLGTGQLQISGTATQGCGYGADLAVRVWVDGDAKDFNATLTTPRSGTAQQQFSLAVPIPADATGGGFSIEMTGKYNVGSRGLIVNGQFGGASAPPPEVNPPAEPAAPETIEVPPDALCKIELIEGSGPVYVGTGDPTGPTPWDRNWGRVQPGQKIWLRPGDTIRTGPGVEVRLMWDRGAVVRVKEQTLFSPQPITTAVTDQSVMYSRLWQGIASFYMEQLKESNKGFEVETERANTSIKGTIFDLEETADATTLTVTEGSVEFRHKLTGEVIIVTAGQRAIATDDGFIVEDQPLSPGAESPAAGGPSVAGGTPANWSDGLADASGAMSPISRYGAQYPGSRDVNFTPDGLAAFAQDTSYIGYAGSRLNPAQGTILVDYYPHYDLVNAYSQNRPAWKKYGQYEPPHQGFIFDTVGWGSAHKGAFELSVLPPTGMLMAQVWDGSTWHNVTWTLPPDFSWDAGRSYEVGITYGPKGLGIVFDGQVQAWLPYTGGIAADQPWFVGQAPWSEPYGPHSLIGIFGNLRVYHQQLGD